MYGPPSQKSVYFLREKVFISSLSISGPFPRTLHCVYFVAGCQKIPEAEKKKKEKEREIRKDSSKGKKRREIEVHTT